MLWNGVGYHVHRMNCGRQRNVEALDFIQVMLGTVQSGRNEEERCGA